MNLKDKNKIKLIINIVGILLFIAILAVAAIAVLPYYKQLKDPTVLKNMVGDNYILSVLMFLGLQVLQVVVAILPGEFVELAAGAAFGWFWGLVFSLVGVAIGTIIIFAVFRKLGKPIIYSLFGEDKLKKLEFINNDKNKDFLIFIFFFIPGLPKDLLTYVAAFFNISVKRFLAISLIARIPSVVTSTIAGSAFLEKNFGVTIGIFIFTGLIAILGIVFNDKIMKFFRKESD